MRTLPVARAAARTASPESELRVTIFLMGTLSIPPASPSIDRSVLLSCFRLLLRPLLRFCVRNCISIQEIIESVKVVLIETTAEELEGSNIPVNVSRLRVATGMHRRDVVRVYRERAIHDFSGTLIQNVLGQWQQNREFLNKSRKPRVLSLEGDDCEFNRLVRAVSVDVHPSSVLDELVRLGAAVCTIRGVRLEHRAFIPKGDPQAGYQLVSRDSEDFLAAVEENIFYTPNPPNLHARTEYDNVSDKDLPQIRSWLYREGSAFHERARNFLSKFDRDLNPQPGKPGGARVVIGSFARTVPAPKPRS